MHDGRAALASARAQSRAQSTSAGALLAAAAALIVGLSVAASSRLTHYPWLGGQALRYAMGAVVLLCLCRLREAPFRRPTRRQAALLATLAATGLVGFNLCLLGAVSAGDPAVVGVIVGCTPVVLAVAAPLLAGGRLRGQVVLAAALVAAGAAVVQGASGRPALLAVLLSLGAVAGEAAFSLLAEPLLPPLGPLVLSAYLTATAALMLLLLALAVNGPRAFPLPTVPEALALVFLALAVTVIAFLCWYSALRTLGAERAGLFAGLIPVSAVLGSVAVGTTALTAGRLAGAALVGGAVALGLAAGPREKGA